MKKGLILVLLLCLAFAGFAEGGAEAEMTSDGFVRSETIYATGGMWQTPGNFNPINWDVPGPLRGLTYESLFLYDPITNSISPWIATAYEWQGKELVIDIREGLTFSDGTPLTVEDVQFSMTYPSWSQVWSGAEEVLIEGNSVRVIFTEDPAYHSTFNNLITWPVLKKAYWETIPPDEAVDSVIESENAIGSGPYVIDGFDQDRVYFKRNDNWWGKSALGIEFPAKTIVYLKSMANPVASQLMIQGQEIDLMNNYMAGAGTLKGQYAHLDTWYDDAPHFIPDNVVYIVPNTTVGPLADVEFRKALAFAVNVEELIEIAYENSVTGINSNGMLDIPAWSQYKNQDLIDQYGFNYDPAKAAELLDAAGYVDADGDGWRDMPDGTTIELKFSVPIEYTDFKDAVDIMTDHFMSVGLNIIPDNPDSAKWQSDVIKGHFDLTVFNWFSAVSHSPWTSYSGLFSSYQPIGIDDWSGNWGRFQHDEIADLIFDLDATPMEDVAACNEIIRKIQTILLTEMPVIPTHVNGMWAVYNNKYWTNWPAASADSKAYPSTYPGKMQLGGVMMFANVRPVQ